MKNFFKIASAVLLIFASEKALHAQCLTPAPPAVSGSTVAGCVSSASFTLTGTGATSNTIGWYANSFGGNALSTNSVFTTPTLTSGATYYVGQSTPQASTDALAMPSFSRNVPAQETRGYFFTAPVDLMITGLRVPVAIGGTVSGIAVLKFPTAPPLYTSVTNTFSTLYLDQAITGTNIVSVNIPVYAGDIIGVLGERNDTSAYGPNPGTGVFPSMLGASGPTVNLYRMGMLYNLATQTPTNIWTENLNTIGIVEMYVQQVCNSSLTPVTVTVSPVPSVTVTPPPSICANSSYTLQAGGTTSFTWTGGPQTSSYVVNPSSTTTYSVRGSIGPSCTTSITTVTLSVDPGLPTMTISSSSNVVCAGSTLVLNGGGAPSYTWSGAATTITDNVPFVPLATQQYTLSGTNACGVGSSFITVTVNPTPTLVTTATPTDVCVGQSATLTVSGASTYSWAGASSVGATFVVTPSVSALHFVTGTNNVGCSSTTGQVLIVKPSPTVTAGAVLNKTLVCSASTVTLTSSGASSYLWDTGAQTATAQVSPSMTTVYSVTGTDPATQCSATATVVITVFIPTLSLTSNTSVCQGASATLTVNAGTGSTYLWSTGFPGNQTSITPSVTASYSVTVQTPTANGVICPSTGSVLVTVNPLPSVQIAATKTIICKGEKMTLTASGGTAYVWTNPSATTATVSVNPNAVSVTTTYSVNATDANGCVNGASIGLKVAACTGIDRVGETKKLISILPNPNNGFFAVVAETGMQLVLCNELGQVIKNLEFSEENHFQQHIEGLSNGIYFITGMHKGYPVQTKLVVEK